MVSRCYDGSVKPYALIALAVLIGCAPSAATQNSQNSPRAIDLPDQIVVPIYGPAFRFPPEKENGRTLSDPPA
jgi:hypothetical protein